MAVLIETCALQLDLKVYQLCNTSPSQKPRLIKSISHQLSELSQPPAPSDVVENVQWISQPKPPISSFNYTACEKTYRESNLLLTPHRSPQSFVRARLLFRRLQYN